MNSGYVINFILYAIIIYMLFRIVQMNKRQKKNRMLIYALQKIENADDFFSAIENVITTMNDPEYVSKAEVLKLWGICYHKRWDEFEETLNQIDLEPFFTTQKNRISIENDEDSFFYLYLAIPEMLYDASQLNERNLLKEKMNTVHEKTDGQLVLAISEANDDFYENKNDRGLSFYEKIMNGDYGEYWYSRNMIGLYKDICASMCGKLYQDAGKTDQFNEILPFIQNFHETGIGKRWLTALNVELPDENDEQEDNEEAEDETFELENKKETEQKDTKEDHTEGEDQ